MFSNNALCEKVNKHFIAAWEMIRPATKLLFESKEHILGTIGGGNSVLYFCDPKGRVLHIIPGVPTQENFLKELEWTLSLYEKARGPQNSISLDSESYRQTIATAHRKKRNEDMLKNRIHFMKMVSGFNDIGKASWSAEDFKTLTTNEIVKESLHRLDTMSNQNRVIASMYSLQFNFQERIVSIPQELQLVHLILGYNPLPRVKEIQRDIFEVILREPLEGYEPVEAITISSKKGPMIFDGKELFRRKVKKE